MDKRTFFDNLHKSLGEKYSIHPHRIAVIRSFSLGRKWSREDIMDWADEKILNNKRNHCKPKERDVEIFNFLEFLSDEAWNDITQKTKYD